MSRRDAARYELSYRDMLSHGLKYGEPWAEDKRALEDAYAAKGTRQTSYAPSSKSSSRSGSYTTAPEYEKYYSGSPRASSRYSPTSKFAYSPSYGGGEATWNIQEPSSASSSRHSHRHSESYSPKAIDYSERRESYGSPNARSIPSSSYGPSQSYYSSYNSSTRGDPQTRGYGVSASPTYSHHDSYAPPASSWHGSYTPSVSSRYDSYESSRYSTRDDPSSRSAFAYASPRSSGGWSASKFGSYAGSATLPRGSSSYYDGDEDNHRTSGYSSTRSSGGWVASKPESYAGSAILPRESSSYYNVHRTSGYTASEAFYPPSQYSASSGSNRGAGHYASRDHYGSGVDPTYYGGYREAEDQFSGSEEGSDLTEREEWASDTDSEEDSLEAGLYDYGHYANYADDRSDDYTDERSDGSSDERSDVYTEDSDEVHHSNGHSGRYEDDPYEDDYY